MKILIVINQDSAAFQEDPKKAVRNALTLAGNQLTSGSVHGTALSLDGDALISWRVLEYVNPDGELIQNP